MPRYPVCVIRTARAQMPTPFPYIPACCSARVPYWRLRSASCKPNPDVFIFDGMGRAHPRRIWYRLAHGSWLQKPTIGCSKTLLSGHFREPPNDRGAFSDLVDRGEVIGAVLRTRATVKPVFISVGHRADLATSVELVMRCTSKYRLPDPIRAAHNAAGAF
ncbi:MAG: endonuclease V [Anaerolineae bacterium]